MYGNNDQPSSSYLNDASTSGFSNPQLFQTMPDLSKPPPELPDLSNAYANLNLDSNPEQVWDNEPMSAHQSEKSQKHKRHKRKDAHKEKKTKEDLVEDGWEAAMRELDEQDKLRNKIGLLVANRYRVTQKVATGSYGQIFAVEDIEDPNMNYQLAAKFEAPVRGGTHLEYEYKVYRVIAAKPRDSNPSMFPPAKAFNDLHTSYPNDEAVVGVPKVHWFGNFHSHNAMVLDLLGPSLEQLLPFSHHRIELHTLLLLARQMLHRIRHIHRCGFIHRDIKPENFLIGLGDKMDTLYLIDFGLSRRYRFRHKSLGLQHIPFRNNRSLVGTARYASLNSHQGYELSRRDDIESFAYVLLYFIRGGNMPWSHLTMCREACAALAGKQARTQAYNRIYKVKQQSPEQLFGQYNVPQLAQLLRYARELQFDHQPDYDYCDSLILQAMSQNSLSVHAPLQFTRNMSDEQIRRHYYSTFEWTNPKSPSVLSR